MNTKDPCLHIVCWNTSHIQAKNESFFCTKLICTYLTSTKQTLLLQKKARKTWFLAACHWCIARCHMNRHDIFLIYCILSIIKAIKKGQCSCMYNTQYVLYTLEYECFCTLRIKRPKNTQITSLQSHFSSISFWHFPI